VNEARLLSEAQTEIDHLTAQFAASEASVAPVRAAMDTLYWRMLQAGIPVDTYPARLLSGRARGWCRGLIVKQATASLEPVCSAAGGGSIRLTAFLPTQSDAQLRRHSVQRELWHERCSQRRGPAWQQARSEGDGADSP
jgi:hypothetical protein